MKILFKQIARLFLNAVIGRSQKLEYLREFCNVAEKLSIRCVQDLSEVGNRFEGRGLYIWGHILFHKNGINVLDEDEPDCDANYGDSFP